MRKLLDYKSVTDSRQNLITVRSAGGSLQKLASEKNKFRPSVLEFISKLSPKDRCHYSLCTALGAGEFWSSNVNGDFFEKPELLNHHSTFLNGTPFMHHVNKDPNKGYGSVLFSDYNPNMNRVELVVEYDTDKLPKNIVSKLQKEELVNLSMGCKVPYDVCSICGKQAPTPKDYCDHVTRIGLNTVLPDGRKVYVLNPSPDFFDISIVIVPADKTACILAKLFPSLGISDNTAQDPLRGFYGLAMPSSVNAEICKHANITASESAYDKIESISFSDAQEIAHNTKTAAGLLGAIKKASAYFKPNDIQAILFIQNNMPKMAAALLNQTAYFECNGFIPVDLGEVVKAASIKPKHHVSNKLIKTAAGYHAMPLNAIALSEDNGSVLGLTPELLSQIARTSMMTAAIGMGMTAGLRPLIPMAGLGASIAAKFMLDAKREEAAEIAYQKDRARDLYIEPLIRIKKAGANLTLREMYSIPISVASYEGLLK